ncbi:hypothetical protein C0Q70_14836 [Pomacea canaliculata]|uniref:Uncharacterized protein n=1 Tax=Pomacea canaliculata TaxID=400727 RepID=A0A2T7NT57_POMCA|nr:hypothetical protein C0Q70_14836 [Pomacea canaliculata]
MALSCSTPVVVPAFWFASFFSSLVSGKEWEPTIISEYDNVTCKLRMRIAPSLDTAFSYDVAAVRTDGQEEYEDRCLNVRGKLEVHCEISGIPTDTPCEYQIMVQARDVYGKAISQIHRNATRICISSGSHTQATVRSESSTRWETNGSQSSPPSETIASGNSSSPVEADSSWRLILIILFAVVTLFVLAAVFIVCIKKSLRHRQMGSGWTFKEANKGINKKLQQTYLKGR